MTLSEFKEWKVNPQTVEFFDYLKRLREITKEEWAQALFVGDTSDETTQRNSAALGQVKLLDVLVRTSQEDIEESKDEFKQQVGY